jgi:UDP-N-acetylmuramoylalanine--D-glutamate ligase
MESKRVLVIGLGSSGSAASALLRKRGARVVAVDDADNEVLRREASRLRAEGTEVLLGAKDVPVGDFDFVVTSPGVPPTNPILSEMTQRGVPVIGELELGYQQSLCLHIAITGTNGKTTTTELVERLLQQNQTKTIAAGNIGRPVSAVVDQTADLDFLTLEVSSFQLETTQFFRPVIAVLLNLTPDHFDRYCSMEEYIRAKARIFMNQQAFDWAIVQSEALAKMKALGVSIPSKVITFSATDATADIYLDRGLLISRMEGWSGPLLDMDHCRLRGPHNAENLMAALAVGRVLRIGLNGMVESLKTYEPAAHRCEVVAEVDGVTYINDSKATNVDAVQKALLSVLAAPDDHPNVWLIAGGKDKGLGFHEIGPVLTRKVKGALLIGETREKIRAAWSLFTPCTLMDSLGEAVNEAARRAAPGDVVLLSPACSSFDQFRDYKHRGEVFRQAVQNLKSLRSAPGGRTNGSLGGAGPLTESLNGDFNPNSATGRARELAGARI